jgi:hypothetical protein
MICVIGGCYVHYYGFLDPWNTDTRKGIRFRIVRLPHLRTSSFPRSIVRLLMTYLQFGFTYVVFDCSPFVLGTNFSISSSPPPVGSRCRRSSPDHLVRPSLTLPRLPRWLYPAEVRLWILPRRELSADSFPPSDQPSPHSYQRQCSLDDLQLALQRASILLSLPSEWRY